MSGDSVLSGGQGRLHHNAWGSHWRIDVPLERVWPSGSQHVSRRASQLAKRQEPASGALGLLAAAFPGKTVFLDLETCGLAGSTIFLAGLLIDDSQGLSLIQLWARTYAEEKPLLQTLWDLIGEKQVLVTFNGKSFDWPLVHDRSTLHHLGYRQVDSSSGRGPQASLMRPGALIGQPLERDHARPEPYHVDLLHCARRRWRDRLPNYRLKTLERYICGRHRGDDLPGSLIPSAYHDYVRTGNTQLVQQILHHNALDLVTLLQLTMVLLEV